MRRVMVIYLTEKEWSKLQIYFCLRIVILRFTFHCVILLHSGSIIFNIKPADILSSSKKLIIPHLEICLKNYNQIF